MIRTRHEVDNFDVEMINKYMKMIIDPTNMNIQLRSKEFEGKTEHIMPHYLTKYSIESISPDFMKCLQNPKQELKGKSFGLPPPNKMIATNFEIAENEPVLIKKWPGDTDIWYKKDEKFGLPKSFIKLKIYTNDCLFSHDTRANVFMRVW